MSGKPEETVQATEKAPAETRERRQGGYHNRGRNNFTPRNRNQNDQWQPNREEQPQNGRRQDFHQHRGGFHPNHNRIFEYKVGEDLPEERPIELNKKPIIIRHKPHEIRPYLTEEQQAQIKELDDKIKELNAIEKPTRDETDKIVTKVDREIAICENTFKESLAQKKAAINEKAQAYSNLPNREERDAIHNHVRDLEQKQQAIEAQITVLSNKLQENKVQSEEARHKLGAGSVEQIDQRIEELEEILQTESHTLQGEKKILTQIDQLKASKSKMGKLVEINENGKKIFQDRSALNEQLRSIKSELFAAKKARKEINEKFKPQMEAINKYDEKIKALEAKLNECNTKRNELREQRNHAVAAFFTKYDNYRKTEYELLEKAYQKKLILKAAEHELEKKLHEDKAAEEAPERVIVKNPHEKEYNASVSLIQYLKEIQERYSKESGEALKPFGGKQVSAQYSELINSVKKEKKSKKAKKVNTTLEHSLQTHEQFHIVDIKVPTDVSEIPATLQLLEQKKEEYTFIPPPEAPPAEKPAEQPAEVPAEKPAEAHAEKPAEQ